MDCVASSTCLACEEQNLIEAKGGSLSPRSRKHTRACPRSSTTHQTSDPPPKFLLPPAPPSPGKRKAGKLKIYTLSDSQVHRKRTNSSGSASSPVTSPSQHTGLSPRLSFMAMSATPLLPPRFYLDKPLVASSIPSPEISIQPKGLGLLTETPVNTSSSSEQLPPTGTGVPLTLKLVDKNTTTDEDILVDLSEDCQHFAANWCATLSMPRTKSSRRGVWYAISFDGHTFSSRDIAGQSLSQIGIRSGATLQLMIHADCWNIAPKSVTLTEKATSKAREGTEATLQVEGCEDKARADYYLDVSASERY